MQTELKLYTNVKLPAYAIEEIKKMAEERFLPTRTMLRMWIMERLTAERIQNTCLGGEVGTTSPRADDHHTHNGAGANDSPS